MNTSSWHSYPKVWSLGHSAIRELFLDPVHLEEKIDGSQFSFGRFGDELKLRSKGKEFPVDAPEKMFQKAVDTVLELEPYLKDGWTYRAEYLQSPKHNVLAYSRAPIGNLILFDTCTAEETYLSYEEKRAEAARLGLEVVPCFHQGVVSSFEEFLALMDRESCLGGPKIEGVVIKNYRRFGMDKKVLLGKHVSAAFKEMHEKNWKIDHKAPGQGELIEALALKFRSTVRFQKAVQHLRDDGRLEGSMRDIGSLLLETKQDARVELESAIKDELFAWAWPILERKLVHGLPDWYKAELTAKQEFASPV